MTWHYCVAMVALLPPLLCGCSGHGQSINVCNDTAWPCESLRAWARRNRPHSRGVHDCNRFMWTSLPMTTFQRAWTLVIFGNDLTPPYCEHTHMHSQSLQLSAHMHSTKLAAKLARVFMCMQIPSQQIGRSRHTVCALGVAQKCWHSKRVVQITQVPPAWYRPSEFFHGLRDDFLSFVFIPFWWWFRYFGMFAWQKETYTDITQPLYSAGGRK